MNEHNHTTLEARVMSRIEQEGTAPRPRLYFTTRNVLVWALAAAAVAVGSLAFGSILFRMSNIGRIVAPHAEAAEFARVAIAALPLFWFVLLAACGYVAYHEIRNTRAGYRYELSTLLGGLVIASIVLGTLFYGAGSAAVADRIAAKHMPFHPDLEELQEERWEHPAAGMLVGEVEAVDDAGFDLEDPVDTRWSVAFDASVPEAERTLIARGIRVGVVGVLLDQATHQFLACRIRSLELRGRTPFVMFFERTEGDATSHVRITVDGESFSDTTRMNGCEDR
jgi:hypothetical protein